MKKEDAEKASEILGDIKQLNKCYKDYSENDLRICTSNKKLEYEKYFPISVLDMQIQGNLLAAILEYIDLKRNDLIKELEAL